VVDESVQQVAERRQAQEELTDARQKRDRLHSEAEAARRKVSRRERQFRADSKFTADPWRGLTISERYLADTHGQIGMFLTLSAVRPHGRSYHSQADSAGSIPVTRSTREKRCSTSESDCISQAGQRSFASENGTRAIARALSHRGECPWRLSVHKLTVRLQFPGAPLLQELDGLSAGIPERVCADPHCGA
jgi:hypothetical protein